MWSGDWQRLVTKRFKPSRSRQRWRCAQQVEGLESRSLLSATLLKDINTEFNVESSHPDQFTTIGSRTYFAATTARDGRELWVTDGTAAGTRLLADIWSGSEGSFPSQLTAVKNVLFFVADNGLNGNELWCSDGTASGTRMVRDLTQAESSQVDLLPQSMVSFRDTLYFTYDQNLWKSDGTPAGTVQVSQLPQRQFTAGPFAPIVLNNTLFFIADDGVSGLELWKSDGSTNGTTRVIDLSPGSSISFFSSLHATSESLYFVTESPQALWSTDGTARGTHAVYIPTGEFPIIDQITPLVDKLYFASSGRLMVSDGTAVGTVAVSSGQQLYTATHLKAVGDDLYFINTDELLDSDSISVFRVDNSTGTQQVATVRELAEFYQIVDRFRNDPYYLAYGVPQTGAELARSDASGISLIADINGGTQSSNPENLLTVGNTLFFTVQNRNGVAELWRTDGTAVGTHKLPTTTNGRVRQLFALNGTLYFTLTDGFYSTLWKSNGTQAGTQLAANVSLFGDVIVVNDTLYFAADDTATGRELWKSDGTQAGTMRVADIDLGPTSSHPSNLQNVGGKLQFRASSDVIGFWTSDGTASGTQRVLDANAVIGDSATIRNTLFYTVQDRLGTELWMKDIATSNTMLVADIWQGAASSNPTSLVSVNGTLYFLADDGVYGRELWTSDGTAAGTTLVRDINPGPNSADISSMSVIDGRLVFNADNGQDGSQLWVSDGTAAGTYAITSDQQPGSNQPRDAHRVGAYTVFVATDPQYGTELFVLNQSALNRRPVVSRRPEPVVATEDSRVSFTLPTATFEDPDSGDRLRYSATRGNNRPLPEWLHFNRNTLTFSGTPTNDDVRQLVIKITATDLAGAKVTTNFALTVQNTNDPPQVADPLPVRAAREDANYFYQVRSSAFRDIDRGDVLTYSVTRGNGRPLPSWLRFDPRTRILSGTPTNADVGLIGVRVSATDSSSTSASQIIQIPILNSNDAPVVGAIIPNQVVSEHVPFSFTISADAFRDVDVGDSLKLLVSAGTSSSLPPWVQFDPNTRTFSGTPPSSAVGTWGVRVQAMDLGLQSATQVFYLIVSNTNDSPVVVQPIPDQGARVGTSFLLQVPPNVFRDDDADAVLTYSASRGNGQALPRWLSFDTLTQTFSGTPTAADIGLIGIKLEVSDGVATASDLFVITITASAQTIASSALSLPVNPSSCVRN